VSLIGTKRFSFIYFINPTNPDSIDSTTQNLSWLLGKIKTTRHSEPTVEKILTNSKSIWEDILILNQY
jgi:hypothetical protein